MDTNHSEEIKPASGISSTQLLTLAKASKVVVLFAAVFIFYLIRFTVIACGEWLVKSKTYERFVVISLKRLSFMTSILVLPLAWGG